MNPARDEWAHALAGVLEAHADAVVQTAPGRWTFAPAGVPGPRATAVLTDDWLLFDAPLPAPAPEMSVWDVLAANALLPGGLKGCTGAPDGALRLRAELPLVEQVPVVRAAQKVCAGLAAAAAWLQPGALAGHSEQRAPAPGAGDAVPVDLQQLCAETAWPFTPRGSTTVMVELEVPGDFQQAAVALDPIRGLVVSVPVLSEPPGTPVCATAVGAFLLRVTGAVRMARAARDLAGVPVYFEVVHAAVPEPRGLAEGFAALSLAWRWAGREAAVLAGDEHVARLYLQRAPPRIPYAPVQSIPVAH